MIRTETNLLQLASRIAVAKRAPSNVVIKEMLHYEILYAMIQSGASESLAFQGGTALRLCHRGTRYSEDLDFAQTAPLDEAALGRFMKVLKSQVFAAYGLKSDVDLKSGGGEAVKVAKWVVRIQVPNPNPSIVQKQVINIEIADVPARDVERVAVQTNYDHLPPAFQMMLIPVETQREILADKAVALVARPFLKSRDLWDIKMLLDRGFTVDEDLVRLKFSDYGVTPERYAALYADKTVALSDPALAKKYVEEMARFVDAPVAPHLPSLATQHIETSRKLLSSLGSDLLALEEQSGLSPTT